MLDENWVRFTQTGNIYDYLKYRQAENGLKAENDAQNYEGFSNQRADDRGE